MKNLSPSLLAAQRSPERIPFVKLQCSNTTNGLVKLAWERLYTGSEEDFYHAATMPGDGSLIRVRVTTATDGRKLYRQRTASPDPFSDFSSWTYTNQYNCLVVAAASLGAEVSIFWINTSRELCRLKSASFGIAWDSPEIIDYSPSTAVNSLAVAYKPNGDLAVFFGDQSVLYVKKYSGGSWQTTVAWNKTTGDLSGIAAVYSGDYCLLVTGIDTSGDFKAWWLVYGDGYQLPVEEWSALNEIASAPAGGDFTYASPSLDKPDVFRCFYIEKFAGSDSYSRPFWTHSIPGTALVDTLWREAVPFDLSSQYGLAMTHHGNYCWLSAPHGVWRASLEIQTADLSADVLSLKSTSGEEPGVLTAELLNDDGRYSSPPALLRPGDQIDVSPGYLTGEGNESGIVYSYSLHTYEHNSAAGSASLRLESYDGWAAISAWTARCQIRWNKEGNEKNVKEILAFVVGRAGMRMEVKSASDVISGFYPDFTIHTGDRGDAIIHRLLAFVPDYLFIEGNVAYLVFPQSCESPSYQYGILHPVLQGHYRSSAPGINRVRVEGYQPSTGGMIVSDSFDWADIGVAASDRLTMLQDRNLDTLEKVQTRGETVLRKVKIFATGGTITVPVNCGQQLFDVVEITDGRAGLDAVKKRVIKVSLLYEPRHGRYEQLLALAAV